MSQTGRFTECISTQDLRCVIQGGLTKSRILFILIVSGLGYLLSLATPVLADTWPIKPIKIVVPFPAGGPADSLVRPLAEALNKKHGYTVIVENKPGANAAIASQFVAKSAPDGYTFLLGSDAGLSLAPATQKTLPYDAAKDFAAVTMVAQFSQVLTVNPNFPVKTIQDLQVVASKAPNSVSYASIGFGSQSHIALETLSKALNIKMIHVPYTGAPPATTDLVAGNVQVMISTVAGPLPFIKTGKVRAIGIAGPERIKSLPNVPTFAELGMPQFESRGWFGIVAPARTSPDIIRVFSRQVWEITQSEEYTSKVIDFFGFDVAKVSPQNFKEFLIKDRAKWKELVVQMGDAINN